MHRSARLSSFGKKSLWSIDGGPPSLTCLQATRKLLERDLSEAYHRPWSASLCSGENSVVIRLQPPDGLLEHSILTGFALNYISDILTAATCCMQLPINVTYTGLLCHAHHVHCTSSKCTSRSRSELYTCPPRIQTRCPIKRHVVVPQRARYTTVAKTRPLNQNLGTYSTKFMPNYVHTSCA